VNVGTEGRQWRPRTVSDLLEEIDCGIHELIPTPWSSGFELIDRVIGGGIFPGDLLVVAGRPGVGKTILALQMARNLARQGISVTYLCFEHQGIDLLRRLLVLEAREASSRAPVAIGGSGYRSDAVDGLLCNQSVGHRGLLTYSDPVMGLAREAIDKYADRLTLASAHPGAGSFEKLVEIAQCIGPEGGVIFVDYLQKVETVWEGGPGSVSGGLKDLAIGFGLGVVAVSAVEGTELSRKRQQLSHIADRGTVAYDADTVLVLNDKHLIINPSHQQVTTVALQRLHARVVVTVDKCRRSIAPVDVELVKDFSAFRFEPEGSHVTEQLIVEG
jgi:replicative DNA helicase